MSRGVQNYGIRCESCTSPVPVCFRQKLEDIKKTLNDSKSASGFGQPLFFSFSWRYFWTLSQPVTTWLALGALVNKFAVPLLTCICFLWSITKAHHNMDEPASGKREHWRFFGFGRCVWMTSWSSGERSYLKDWAMPKNVVARFCITAPASSLFCIISETTAIAGPNASPCA